MFALVKVLLYCSLSWVSVSVSEFNTVDVQSGEQATLLCSNYTSSPTQIMWFRVLRRLKPQCISSIFKASEPASFCEGFQNGKFEATANMSTIFLKIKPVDSSDSGLYFCGFYIQGNTVIVEATYLDVQNMFDGTLASVILSVLNVLFITVILGLAVRIKKLQKDHIEDLNHTEDSEDLNYASVTFRPKSERNLRPALNRKVESNAIYSATRGST